MRQISLSFYSIHLLIYFNVYINKIRPMSISITYLDHFNNLSSLSHDIDLQLVIINRVSLSFLFLRMNYKYINETKTKSY